uniref:Uncharacterized protein n=1 Tax=Picea glauca TaxID=3330 RepID=A0A101LTW8_PICGL|nr:hypothetical protein ABT39_MTgene3506 [Picea glauca]KUM46398.1 hypothetical protein ABT39_MTgene1497 [Picea glauca]
MLYRLVVKADSTRFCCCRLSPTLNMLLWASTWNMLLFYLMGWLLLRLRYQ